MADFFGLLRRLAEAKVDFVLVGGLAAAAHGSSLVTQDVGICIRLGSENLERLRDALKGLEPAHRRVHPPLAFEHDAATLASFRNVYLRTTLGQLDCLGEVLGVGNFLAVYEQSVEIDLNGIPCRVISIDALIRAKEAMNRDRDRLAVEQLRPIRSLQPPPLPSRFKSPNAVGRIGSMWTGWVSLIGLWGRRITREKADYNAVNVS